MKERNAVLFLVRLQDAHSCDNNSVAALSKNNQQEFFLCRNEKDYYLLTKRMQKFKASKNYGICFLCNLSFNIFSLSNV